ncbi:unnamed protein product [Rotaria sp. Silwood1]|nr:unnamed protein product [Rotaria sp. Silwood1]CAF1682670.1 unnamed protein product [Rotaria sp. Silwood1]CAF3933521.1 unnamed protein product [Rotaria sp. Silwood1]
MNQLLILKKRCILNHGANTPVSRRSIFYETFPNISHFDNSISAVSSIYTYPDLPLHVTHDHDDDRSSNVSQDLDSDPQSKVTNTPPKRNVKPTEK